jgi:hypothetical protein
MKLGAGAGIVGYCGPDRYRTDTQTSASVRLYRYIRSLLLAAAEMDDDLAQGFITFASFL